MLAPNRFRAPISGTSSSGVRPSRWHSSMIGLTLSSTKARTVSRTIRSSSVRSVSISRKSTPGKRLKGDPPSGCAQDSRSEFDIGRRASGLWARLATRCFWERISGTARTNRRGMISPLPEAPATGYDPADELSRRERVVDGEGHRGGVRHGHRADLPDPDPGRPGPARPSSSTATCASCAATRPRLDDIQAIQQRNRRIQRHEHGRHGPAQLPGEGEDLTLEALVLAGRPDPPRRGRGGRHRPHDRRPRTAAARLPRPLAPRPRPGADHRHLLDRRLRGPGRPRPKRASWTSPASQCAELFLLHACWSPRCSSGSSWASRGCGRRSGRRSGRRPRCLIRSRASPRRAISEIPSKRRSRPVRAGLPRRAVPHPVRLPDAQRAAGARPRAAARRRGLGAGADRGGGHRHGGRGARRREGAAPAAAAADPLDRGAADRGADAGQPVGRGGGGDLLPRLPAAARRHRAVDRAVRRSPTPPTASRSCWSASPCCRCCTG